MKKLLTFCITLFIFIEATAQNIELTFTALVDQSYITLDSIKIMNRTQDCDTVLIYPDTMLSMTIEGVNPHLWETNSISLSQNYPNPFTDQTSFSVFLSDKDYLNLMIHNLLGQKLAEYNAQLDAGTHHFTFYPGQDNWYVVTAKTSKGSQSIKMSCLGSGSSQGSIVRNKGLDFNPVEKESLLDDYYEYTFGDTLLFVGYTNSFAGVLESGILDTPEESNNYIFQYATNIPCPGTPTVDYEGQVYNTIQIFSQCWLKENLNVGIMITGSQNQTNNGTIEKYCYDNDTNNCVIYGGLYQWNEMMQYTTQQDAQGICPQGWHLPTDEEWKVLEGAVDSQYGIGDNTWDIVGTIRGYDAGANLKSTSGWYENGNGTDLYGFSVLPGGRRESNTSFLYMGEFGIIWASTESSNLYSRFRAFSNLGPTIARGTWTKLCGWGVRCIRDE